jgi:hypothetical protein
MAQIPKEPRHGIGRAPTAVRFRQGNSTATEQNPGPRQDLSIMVWAAFASAILREHAVLTPDDPRRRPSLPRLRFMQRDLAGGSP